MAVAASQVDLVNVGLLGNGRHPAPRTSSTPYQMATKGFRLAPAFGGKTDFVEVEGMEPIEGVSADWSDALVHKVGALSSPGHVHFDHNNPGGSALWGSAADGALVVAVRGLTDFDVMANNAAESGALGLIVVDNEPKLKNTWVMTKDNEAKPTIPAVLVAQKHAQLLCSGLNGAHASIVRRKSKLGGTKIATNMMKAAAWPLF